MSVTQLEALEATRLEVARATQEEITVGRKEKQELQSQLEAAQQLLHQQSSELQALKAKISQNVGLSTSLGKGAARACTSGSMCTQNQNPAWGNVNAAALVSCNVLLHFTQQPTLTVACLCCYDPQLLGGQSTLIRCKKKRERGREIQRLTQL